MYSSTLMHFPRAPWHTASPPFRTIEWSLLSTLVITALKPFISDPRSFQTCLLTYTETITGLPCPP